MVRITSPRLVIGPCDPDRPGSRRIRIDYDVQLPSGDPVTGLEVAERLVLVAVDRHDAPARPRAEPVAVLDGRFVALGDTHRSIERDVARASLDVGADWWTTDDGGGTVPIAEWPDHLVARVELALGDRLVAEASTPVVTGSWGALGPD